MNEKDGLAKPSANGLWKSLATHRIVSARLIRAAKPRQNGLSRDENLDGLERSNQSPQNCQNRTCF
jgi:hypothetical protein